MSISDFEARYQADRDPWRYATSAYEREKYAATLAACGPGPFASALELGSSIGVFSELLVDRCDALVTVDAAPSAVALARERLAGPNVTMILGRIPDAIPRRPYDLVVASEILYYLPPDAFTETLTVLRELLPRGGRLVAVHWRPPGPERPFSAEQVHQRLGEQPWLSSTQTGGTSDYRLDVLERT